MRTSASKSLIISIPEILFFVSAYFFTELYFFLTSINLLISRPEGSIALPFLSNTPTILGLSPYLAYKSSDLDSSSFAKL
jgi:hypothetical protein